jgi:hypothetical protein
MRVPAAVVLLALAVAGCGQQGSSTAAPAKAATSRAPAPPAPSASPSPLVGQPTAPPSPSAGQPPAPPPVVVTAGVREVTARLRVGQLLVVRSTPGRPSGGNAFVAETGGSVLRRAGGNQLAGWRFLALGRGTAHVVVAYGPQCVPGELCPMFRGLLARVTVTVA